METIFRIQNELQIEAMGIVEELGILEMLSNFGEARIVGSVAHKLIVKKDIDIHILTSHDLLKTTFLVLDFLRNKDKSFEISYEDFRNQKSSMFIGLKNYSGVKYDWYVDIWITEKREYTGFAQVECFKKILTDQQRKVILQIKEYYNELDMLNDGFSSIIYEAVLNGDVTDRVQFERYLQEKRN